ncbi:hypothetical protein [Methylobacterium sp. P1-11]|uniref:hypothetical protein n=1 Tax=Methylobacterium sp. P1-11 TaxID=2024616 RepID=UPI0015653991|nr:hypothetical protein [Methylobacterium sp. P1-11]
MNMNIVVMINVFQLAGAWATWSMGICNSSLSSDESDGSNERSGFSPCVSNGHGERRLGSEVSGQRPMVSDATEDDAAPQRSPNDDPDYQGSHR